MTERTVKIMDILASSGKVKVNLLAEMLDVSYVTLRKDLDKLEKKGIICHIHGYATLDGADSTGKRMAIYHLIKRKIAKAAAQIVEESETVMLESGSCCALLAEELALAKKNITIVTNSLFVANYAGKLQKIKIILLGGYLQPESQVLIGPMTTTCAEIVFSDRFFLGTDGFISGYGFTGRDHLCADTAAEMAKRAKKVYVLTESAKFNRRSAYNLIMYDKLAGVFTDDNIPKEAEADIKQNKVTLYKVPSAEEKIKWHQFPGQPPFIYTEK